MDGSHETGSEANVGFGHSLVTLYLGMHPLKKALFSDAAKAFK